MIKHMFLFGVILPTLVTVLLFVAFLVCWFKFNMRERFFSKRKLFSKQLKHAMAPRQASVSKQSHIYTPDHTVAARTGSKDRGGGGAGGAGGTASKGTVSGVTGGISGKAGILSRKPRRYENCVNASAADQEDDMMHEHSVGDDPEAALCGACEDEVMHTQAMAGYSNQCASPTHSAAADDEEEEDDDDDVVMEDDAHDSVARQQRTALPECSIHNTPTLRVHHPIPCSALHPQHQLQLQHPGDDANHTDTEDYPTDDPDVQYVQVKQVGSMFQHTFHFPASECSHLSNSLVAGDSEDGGSEDGSAAGSNYGHFVPLSQLLRDPKARHQFYAAARSRADSPASVSEFCEGSGTAGGGPPAMGVVTCTETGRLITGM